MHRFADAAALQAFGERLAACLGEVAIVYLEGELGAGKTTLARGILRGLGYRDRVRSPSYTLVEPYPLAGSTLYHLDLYRLADAEELEWLGLRDMLEGPAILLVEWPRKGAGSLPAADLVVRIRSAGNAREVYLVAESTRGQQILKCLDS